MHPGMSPALARSTSIICSRLPAATVNFTIRPYTSLLQSPLCLKVYNVEVLHRLGQFQERGPVLRVVLRPLRIAARILDQRLGGIPERHEHELDRVCHRPTEENPTSIAAHSAIVRVGRLLEEVLVVISLRHAG